MKTYDTMNKTGHLFLTAMGRIVLDDHDNETFSLPQDTLLMSKEELNNGLQVSEFANRLKEARTSKVVKEILEISDWLEADDEERNEDAEPIRQKARRLRILANKVKEMEE